MQTAKRRLILTISMILLVLFALGFAFPAGAELADIVLSDDVTPLPLDLEEPGRTPIEENFTETSYQDETIAVQIEEFSRDGTIYRVAYVKIASPTQLRTAIAGSFNSGRTYKASVFARCMNAVVLINGDFYSKTIGGYIVRQGEVCRTKPSDNIDIMLIDENADFHVILRGKDNQRQVVSEFLEEHEIINGFFFGPALVIDGEVREMPEVYVFNHDGPEPRTAIGQLGPLTYVMVTVDGRMDYSRGVTSAQLADFMLEIGCVQAYSLDGGDSSEMVFHNEIISARSTLERTMSDVIYFATAIDESGD